MDTTECRFWQDRDAIRTGECCCEPIKMNIAMVICTICMGWKQRPSIDLQIFAFPWEEVPLLVLFAAKFLTSSSKYPKT